MKKKLSLLSLLLCIFINSQTHRFIYELKTEIYGKSDKINMVLDIDNENVKFYDFKFLEIDSLSKKSGENWMNNTVSDQLIIRKINSSENTEFHDNNFDYVALKSSDKMNWKIESETKKVDHYILQKATTNFGNRKWVAWFNSSIPFQQGPYKFQGLPGLIFELEDENKAFVYKLIKSQNLPKQYDTTNFLETHYGNKPISITQKQYNKMKLDYYSDPVANMSKVLKDGGTVNINNEKITTQDQLDKKRIFLQDAIVKFYNPIELDKAIPYPKK